MKNILYILCEDRNCEWTDFLVAFSMKATVNSTTSTVITSRQYNTSLSKLPHNDITNDHPRAYRMQINALLKYPPMHHP